jgi:hypothetical protein
MLVSLRPVFFSLPSHGMPSVKLRILENFTLYLRNSLSLNLRAIENCICGLRSIGRKMRSILRTVQAVGEDTFDEFSTHSAAHSQDTVLLQWISFLFYFFILEYFVATRPIYFVFSRLYPSSPLATMAVFGSYLSSLYTLNWHCIAGAGLPIHMIGEVSWDQERRWAWASS